MVVDKYIDKAECERRGFVRESDGRFHKLNTLERYARDGWLDFGDNRYSALDRVSAGNRLGQDFYLAGIDSVCANDVRKVRVDGCGSYILSDKRLDARDRFNKAMQAVPYEFWPVVNLVCCEDKGIVHTVESKRQRLYFKHTQANFLCLGLDRLIQHYRKSVKNNY